VYGDYLYVCKDRGELACYEAKTGKRMYEELLDGTYTASAVAADGRIYFTNEEGDVEVIKAGPVFESLATNCLGDPCLATPAICAGLFIVRTQHFVFGIGKSQRPKP
jgi:hypothetical protein